jgi:hypothetical protein
VDPGCFYVVRAKKLQAGDIVREIVKRELEPEAEE